MFQERFNTLLSYFSISMWTYGKLIYAMRVDEKIPLAEYCKANAGKRNYAEHVIGEKGRFAMISNYFYYFGRNAIDISKIPKKHLNHKMKRR